MIALRWALSWLVIVGLVSSPLLADDAPPETSAGRPVLRVVYFIPTDREPEPDFRNRLDRVLSEVQRFYRIGMKENGYGKVSFELDRDADGALRIYEVRGQHPMHDYGRNSSRKVRDEVKAALAQQGLDMDHETVVIFQLLLEWRDGKAVEVGPYVGGGGPRNGTAWVYDDAKLDLRLLASQEPGGYYHGPCSLGQFNTHYIGGVAHELGHAFGLPHDCESDADRPRRGRSLMGGGNHTYGQELRGEGRGAFLSAASALPLSVHPLFTGKRTSAKPQACRFAALHASVEQDKLVLTGQLEGPSPPIGLVARNDAAKPDGDYDAVGWTCSVGPDGKFRLEIGELKPGEYDLRIRAYSQTGDWRDLNIHYQVDEEKRPDLKPFQTAVGE